MAFAWLFTDSHLSGATSCGKREDLCEDGSTCFDHRNGSYSCMCPLGSSNLGENCMKRGKNSDLFFKYTMNFMSGVLPDKKACLKLTLRFM